MSSLLHGLFLVAVRGLPTVVASLVVEHRLWGAWASVAVARGLSCSTACGIFPDQGSNPCLLQWQMDSLPLSHQGSPKQVVLKIKCFIALETYLRSVSIRLSSQMFFCLIPVLLSTEEKKKSMFVHKYSTVKLLRKSAQSQNCLAQNLESWLVLVLEIEPKEPGRYFGDSKPQLLANSWCLFSNLSQVRICTLHMVPIIKVWPELFKSTGVEVRWY